ncbi:MAG TPA: phosphoenolpyruvate--protein phosphotransferase [Lacipirellulaceae bacterium]|nr:phosphoenolpyruvate--protein phosphotransferase [Lacipirellulaceae bacterium]
MERLQGIAVSPGIAIGEALVVDNEGFRIPRRFLPRDAVEEELGRLDRAMQASAAEVERNRDRVAEQLGDEYAAIFSAHLQMLHDRRLRVEIEDMIRSRHYSPEYSVSRALRKYAKVFQSLGGEYMAERANDIFDIEKRLLRNLLGMRREELSQVTSPVLVLARNLTPSETANLNPQFVMGLVTEIGGPGSHTAIVAEGLGIPAVVGVGPFLTDVSGGDTVIIDGDQGQIILRPDEETIARYRHEVEEQRTLAAKLETLREFPAETTDGARIYLMGNIEFPSEVTQCEDRGADGIGLYRTEFLYLGRDDDPPEDAHFAAYFEVAEAMREKPVVMRTLDLGADKMRMLPDPEDERNPFLGLRSIRLALRNRDMFRVQLRAILRASTHGNVRVMFPLISTMLELRQAKSVLADAMEDLDELGMPFDRNIKVGMMVEVPSAVLMMDHFVDEVDFFSIGTNDLIQYCLAVDRSNKDVASLYTAADPAVIRLIDMAVRAADRAGRPISMCGQMCGNPLYTMLLLGIGLRSLSVTPAAVPEVKRVCRSVSLDQCRKIADQVRTLETARDVKTYLKEELSKVFPEFPA